MESQIRRAGAADIPALLKLVEALYRDERITFNAERVLGVLRELVTDAKLGFIVVAVGNGEIMAYAAATYCYSLEFGGKFALLDEIFVAPAARGGGLGSTLIEEIAACCQADGAGSLRLEVERGNERARRLYRRLGFVEHSRSLMTRRLGTRGTQA